LIETGGPTLDELPVKQASQKLIAEARAEHASSIEVVALPSSYEVRFLVEGHPRRKYTLTVEGGERIVERFYQLSDRIDSGVRALPRNTSFGNGVSVEVRPGM
jgi:type II secretory ATPase GspE/PulE/Tfp pilus assembly ATPase PilB-like protein